MSIFGRGSTAYSVFLVTLAWGATPFVAAAQSPPSQDPAAMRQEIELLRKELDELKGQLAQRVLSTASVDVFDAV